MTGRKSSEGWLVAARKSRKSDLKSGETRRGWVEAVYSRGESQFFFRTLLTHGVGRVRYQTLMDVTSVAFVMGTLFDNLAETFRLFQSQHETVL